MDTVENNSIIPIILLSDKIQIRANINNVIISIAVNLDPCEVCHHRESLGFVKIYSDRF